jgi:hypothetical protein
MNMAKFRKKPVMIEAIQWTGNNLEEIKDFMGYYEYAKKNLIIHTLEGKMIAQVNDWIIRGVQGEYYPCKPDIFEQTYELVVEE